MAQPLTHVFPLHDLKVHEASDRCWCRPSTDENGSCIHVVLDIKVVESHGVHWAVIATKRNPDTNTNGS